VVEGYGVVRSKRTIASPPRHTRLRKCYTRALQEPDERLRPHQSQTSVAKKGTILRRCGTPTLLSLLGKSRHMNRLRSTSPIYEYAALVSRSAG